MRYVLPVVLVVGPLCAHDVHVVGSPGDFSSVQAAVDAAADGDTILVRPGTYPGFTLGLKGVNVVGVVQDGERPRIAGMISILGLAAAQTAVVRGLELVPSVSPSPLLRVTGNLGPVLLEDLDAKGSLDIEGSADVVLVRSTFTSAKANASALHAYEVELSGGTGAVMGLRVVDGFAFLSGSLVVGGAGSPGADGTASSPSCSDGGAGGIGLYVEDSAVYRLETTIAGGAGGPPGTGTLGPPCSPGPSGPTVVGSGLVDVPGTARSFEISAPGAEDETVHVRARGAPGEFVYVLVAPTCDPLWFPVWSGSFAMPFTSLVLFLGVLPAPGEIEADFGVGELGPGVEGAQHFAQAAFVSMPGQVVVRIGPPTAVQMIDREVLLIDCNANGVHDATDIATGTSLDCNGNGEPDECDIASGGGSSDCNANGVPDECDIASGTSHDENENQQPDECDPPPLIVPDAFPTIQAALAAAPSKGTVLVRDGVYSGPGFQSLGVDKDVVIMSQNGPPATVLSASSSAYGFYFDEIAGTGTVKGFTLRGFSAAIRVADCSAQVLECVIEDGGPGEGAGGIVVEIGHPLGVPDPTQHTLRIEGCTFEGNQGSAGAIWTHSWWGPIDVTVSNCLFLGNTGDNYAGALFFSNANLVLRNSAFIANSGPWGTVHQSLPSDSIGTSHIEGVTLAGNDSGFEALTIGGSTQFHDVRIANTIVWHNQVPGGDQIQAWVPLGTTAIEWTDIEGGPAAVLSSGALTYGPGNLAVDPLFADLAAGGFHLSPTSPCIDAGDPAYVPLPGEEDLDGETRVHGPAIDMGADEFHP